MLHRRARISDLSVVVAVVAIIHPVVMIGTMMGPQHAIDGTDRATDRPSDNTTYGAADGTGGTIALVRTFIRAPSDALSLSG